MDARVEPEPHDDDAPRQPRAINALLVKVGVNMGDHAETVRHAVSVVDPDETVGQLVERLLTRMRQEWNGRYSTPPVTVREPDPNRVLELRLVLDADQVP